MSTTDSSAALDKSGVVETIDRPDNLITDLARLKSLHGSAVLDTEPEQAFDDIVRLATRLCRVPVALISLVTADRQWFKARIGFPHCQTDLNSSVCKYVLSEPDLLVIADLTTDPRTAANPLVTGEPFIRFYAGAPFHGPDGLALGSLCVIDTKPHPGGLSEEQADDLRALARQVTGLLAMRVAVESRDQILQRQRSEIQQSKRIAVLAKASEALLTATDPASVLDSILTANADALGFDRSYIYTVWPDGKHLNLTHSLNATTGVQEYLNKLPLGAPVCGIVAQQREPLYLAAMQASTDPVFAKAREIGLNAFAGFPLISRGALRGVISFASTELSAFDEETLEFFQTVARMMSAVYERIDGEQALRESDTRSRRAQEAGRVGTFEVDVDTGLISVSPEFARIYGVPETSVYSAQRFEELVVEEDKAVPSNDQTRQDGTAATDVEYRIKRANDGALRWVSRRATFARDENGQILRMFGTVQDVTERHEAQQALLASDERFRTIVETIESAFAIVEVKFDLDDKPVDYRFLEANPAFERQAGVNLRGKWVTEFAPDLEQFWFETYGRVAKTGEPATFESYAEAFKRWFDVRAVRVGAADDRRIAIFFSDVTARKEAESALRTNIERVQLALAAGAIIGTWHWDMPKDRFTVDEAFARSFGLDPALGREGIPLADIVATVHPDDRAGLAVAMGEAIRRGGAYAHQYRVRRADGRYYWLEANGRVDLASDGTPLSFPGVLLDIEDRRAADIRREALLELGARFRKMSSASQVGLDAAEIVGRTLCVGRVGYGALGADRETFKVLEDWTASGFPSLAGTHRISDYGLHAESLRRGEDVVIDDVSADQRSEASAKTLETVSVRSLINVPIVENGETVAVFYVNADKPRQWTDQEVAFVRQVAELARQAAERRRAEEQQAILNLELSHRLKNTLAIVLSIATQTLRTVPDKEPVEAFEKRIHALSHAHDILLKQDWIAAPLDDVAAAVLGNFTEAGRLELSGPRITLGPRATLSTSLLLHELATNAAKYGALSNGSGRVTLAWRVDEASSAPELVLSWEERDGPPVSAPPSRKGFGSRLIKMGLIGTGNVTLSYELAGFRAEMRATLSQVQQS